MSVPAFKVEFGAVPGLPGGVRVAISGPIDAKSVGTFKAQMDGLRARRVRHLLLEMTEVRHINSTGLAYLITLAESIQEAGGALALVDVQPKVKVVFETMGLLGFVRIYPSRAAAVRELRPPAPAPAEPPPAAPSQGTIRRLFRKLFGPPGDRRPV
jgi:anti-anti-sigma factor